MNLYVLIVRFIDMNKSLTIFAFLVLCLVGRAQPKKIGIGSFEINKTTVDIIQKLSEETAVKITQASGAPENYNDLKTTRILELLAKPGSYGSIDPYAPEVKQERVFYLDCYFVSSVLLKDLYLKFWNDTLYSIDCQGSGDIEQAMVLKYGNPKEDGETKTVTCRNGLGIEFTKQEASFYNTWWLVPSKVLASSNQRHYLDDKCKEQFSFTFYISSVVIETKKRKLLEVIRASKDKDAAEKLKAKLKGF